MNGKTYKELKDRQQQEVNNLPIYWAFGDRQYQELLIKLNKTDEEIKQECFGIFGGLAFIKDKELIYSTFKKHREELKEKLNNDNDFLKEALIYELGNHEYIITYDLGDTLEVLGLSREFFENEEKQNILNEAIAEYKKEMEQIWW